MFSCPPPPEKAEPAAPSPEPADSVQADSARAESGQADTAQVERDRQRVHELAMLAAMADAAFALAMSYQKKALAAVESASTGEEDAAAVGYGRAFDRAARTARQCLALKARFAAEDDARQRKAAEARKAEEEVRAAEETLVSSEIAARRATVILAVKDAIDADKRPRAEKEDLYDAIEDILEPFDEEIFLSHSIGHLAQALCQAIGVSLDLKAVQDTAWAREEIFLRPKGSPFAGAWRELEDPPAGNPMARPP